jgi:cytochrome c oxidase subunit 3
LPNGAVAAHDDLHGHDHHHPRLQHHFNDMEQQQEAATLGMWLFLVTEVMFFGGLILTYTLYRIWYPVAWALGSEELNIYLGGFNTAVLIASSLTMAMGVRAAQTGQQKATVRWLLLTMVFGLTFLVVKFFEYKEKFELHHVPGSNFFFPGPEAPHVQIFFSLYFALTGVHALHMIIGLGLMTIITRMAAKGEFTPQWYTPVELAGLYWHFVDIVWIFLFPLLYLVDRSHHII